MHHLIRQKLSVVVDGCTHYLARVARRLGQPASASIPVSAVMLSPLETVSPEQPIEEIVQLLVGGRHAQLPVLVDGHPIGVVTRDDVATGLRDAGPHAPLAAAPCHDVLMVAPSDSLADVQTCSTGCAALPMRSCSSSTAARPSAC